MLAAIIQAVFGGVGTEALHYRIVLKELTQDEDKGPGDSRPFSGLDEGPENRFDSCGSS